MGAWTGQLLPSWATHLRVTRQLQGWVDVASLDTDLFSYQRMPTWVMDKPALSKPLYGVPCDDDAGDEQTRHWLKMGIHGRDNVVEDPTANPTRASEQEYEELLHASQHALDPKLLSKSDQESSFANIQPCLYTHDPRYQLSDWRP